MTAKEEYSLPTEHTNTTRLHIASAALRDREPENKERLQSIIHSKIKLLDNAHDYDQDNAEISKAPRRRRESYMKRHPHKGSANLLNLKPAAESQGDGK